MLMEAWVHVSPETCIIAVFTSFLDSSTTKIYVDLELHRVLAIFVREVDQDTKSNRIKRRCASVLSREFVAIPLRF